MEIELGHGKFRIEGCEREGRLGMSIRKAEGYHEVNEVIENDGRSWTPGEDDIVIWFDSLEGARVLQDQVNAATLRLNGYEVDNETLTGRADKGSFAGLDGCDCWDGYTEMRDPDSRVSHWEPCPKCNRQEIRSTNKQTCKRHSDNNGFAESTKEDSL